MDTDLRALSRAALAAEGRLRRTRRLPVFDCPPGGTGARYALAAPGTVTLYLARRGSPRLREIAESLVRRTGRDVEIAREIRESLELRPRLSVPEAVDRMLAEPVFAELRYGSKPVVNNLFVPEDTEVVSVVFPYNGGRLARDGFTLTEYVIDTCPTGLSGLLVRAAPPLTRAEAVALQLLPPSQLELNVGSAVVDAESDDNLALTLVTLAALAAGVALAAAAEVAVPAAVVAEAAGVGITDVVTALGVEGAATAALDAAVGAAAANMDAATVTAAAAAGDAGVGAGDAGVGAVGAGDVGAGDVGAGDVGAGDVGAGDVGAGDVGAGDVGAGDAGAGDAGAGDAGAGDAIAGDVGAGDVGDAAVGDAGIGGDVGAGDAGAGDVGAGDAGAGDAGAGDAGAGDAGAGDAGAGDAGAGDAGDAGAGDAGDAGGAGCEGEAGFAQRLLAIAQHEAELSGLMVEQILTQHTDDVPRLRELVNQLRPAQTAAQLLASRRTALRARR